MKRSDFIVRYLNNPNGPAWTRGAAERAALLAEAAGVTWDPEEPEGFADFLREWQSVPRLHTPPDLALAAWNACLVHQEAQERAIDPRVDPEVRRKEIEAQIGSWAEFIFRGGTTRIGFDRHVLEADVRTLLRRLGVL